MSVMMMVAMMTPSLVFTLWRERFGWSTTLVCAGYFLVWTVIGAAMYPLGVGLSHAAPILIGIVIVTGAALQLTVCRVPAGGRTGSAWGYGLRLGVDCAWSCAGFMMIVLVVDMADLRVMAIITTAVTLQHVAGHRVRRHSPVAAHPDVNEYAATPGSKNSIRSVRS